MNNKWKSKLAHVFMDEEMEKFKIFPNKFSWWLKKGSAEILADEKKTSGIFFESLKNPITNWLGFKCRAIY